MEPVATTRVVGGRLLHMCGSKCKSAAVCNLAVQQITLDMVIVSPTEVYLRRGRGHESGYQKQQDLCPRESPELARWKKHSQLKHYVTLFS